MIVDSIISKFDISNLGNREFIGEVVDNNDPLKSFRCKVRVFGLFDDLKVEDMPWCMPAYNFVFASNGEGGFGCGSVPKVGSIVNVRFNNGNIYSPEYYSVRLPNKDMINEISSDYENSHVLLYDKEQELKIIYSPNSGIKIFLKQSHITINPDSSITIEHKDSSSIIELEGSNCRVVTNSTVEITSQDKVEVTTSECILNGQTKTQLGPTGQYSAVLAEPLWQFLKALATALDSKYPATPGANSGLAETFEKLSTSKNNKLSM